MFIIGCQQTEAPKQPVVDVPKADEKVMPDKMDDKMMEDKDKMMDKTMETKVPSTQTEIVQSEIAETDDISGIDDTDTTGELDNLDGFVNSI